MGQPGLQPVSDSAIDDAQGTLKAIEAQVGRALEGKPEVIRLALVTLLSRGHLLIEDVPGVGKTTLARALSDAIDASFGRIQCTSDLMPTDVLGGSLLDPKSGEFRFRPGPIFHQIVLADEVNRATPKTQSALLEAMAEGQVSIEGTTHALDPLFFVVATQNPQDFYGTYPLPESQLDRFLLCTRIGYPEPDVEKRLLEQAQDAPREPQTSAASRAVSTAAVQQAQAAVDEVHVEPALHDYLLAIVQGTRNHRSLSHGASTRAALAFARAARANALVSGRDHVLPDDLKYLAPYVLAHRVRPEETARSVAREEVVALIRALVDELPVPL